MKVILIGAGGHAAELNEYIRHCNDAGVSNPYNNLRLNGISIEGFLDDNKDNYNHYNFSAPFLGSIKEHKVRSDCHYLMAIANLAYRKGIIKRFLAEGAHFTGLIHPTAIVAPSAIIGEGTVISHNASVGPKAVLGKFNMLNSRCTIGHDTQMGDYNFISPNVAISGNTKIGDNNLIGTNACTIPGMVIGDNNKIAAGMTIYKSVGDNETVIFRHAEKLIIRTENS